MFRVKFIKLVVAALVLPILGLAQVTTSSISGSVKDAQGKLLEGASITATHLPTGTVYKTVTKKNGVFNIANARIGGPYNVVISYVGLKDVTYSDVFLQLGETYNINATAGDDVKELDKVIVSGSSKKRSMADKTGASTVIGSQQLRNTPNFSRNIADFGFLTPQAGQNNSFGGRDGRYNNIQIDGANLNNNFGLRNDPLPGGSISSPISLDAIEEMSVNIAPIDIRQSNFTGAGLNAVTRSGTNSFKGSAYYYLRTQDMNGRKVKDSTLPAFANSKTRFIGAWLSGPIIKNKLFFFVSGEVEKRDFPGVTWRATGGTGGTQQSATPIDSLRALSTYLQSKFGYNTGAFDNFPSFKADNYKLMGKIDWNINKVHKMTLRYTDYVNNNDESLNGASVINQGGFNAQRIGNTPTTIGTSLPNQRFGPFSMSYANSNYGFRNDVKSLTFELNSAKGSKWANQFLATYSANRATRTTPGTDFPFIDVFNGNGQNQLSAGFEPFSYNNDVKNNTWSVTNNFNYYLGKHTFTVGATYEQQYVGNSFMPGSQSYYVFNSLRELLNDQAPIFFAYTYSLVPGKKQVYSAELKFGQVGAYFQDEINVNPNFKLTLALRADNPIYIDPPLGNPSLDALQFPDKNGVMKNYNTGRWPKWSTLWSPRVGFRWDVEGDKSTIIRGGTGIYTGRIPFVWLTNMPTNANVAQFQGSISNNTTAGATTLAGIRLSSNIDAWRSLFPTTVAPTVPLNSVLIDNDFKFPQIWRTYVAVDKRFDNGLSASFEASIATDVNAVVMRNAALRAPNSTFAGADARPRYDNGGNTALNNGLRRIYSNVQQAIVLENTNQSGFSSFFTATVNKTWSKNLFGSLAYTFSAASELSGNPGAQAGSAWGGILSTGTPNMLQYGNNTDLLPHRILGQLSYRAEFLKRLATTITMVYVGAAQGNFSFRYNNDMNNDGQATADLLYIPTSASALNWAPIAASGSTPAFSVQQQIDAFDQYLNSNGYLRKRRGQYADRNAAYLPFFHNVSLSVRQDIGLFTTKSGKKNTLQFTADIFNFLNLLNRNWGVRQFTLVSDPLVLAGVGGQTGFTAFPAGQPVYQLRRVNINGVNQLPTAVFQDSFTGGSTWGMQIGFRYNFNN